MTPEPRDLTRAWLEDWDPHRHASRGDVRYFCPYCCPDRRGKRNLSANLDDGAWHCFKPSCGAAGKLVEFHHNGNGHIRILPPRPHQRLAQPKPEQAEETELRLIEHLPTERFPCQTATGELGGYHQQRKRRLHRFDGTTDKDKDVVWLLPDGTPSHDGLVHPAELVYMPHGGCLGDIPDGADVVGCEGEGAADALARMLPPYMYVVAFVCGAGSTPAPSILAELARLHFIYWPDNDLSGQSQALGRRIGAWLLEACGRARYFPPPPECPNDRDDAADYERNGGVQGEVLAEELRTAPSMYGELQAAWQLEHAAAADEGPPATGPLDGDDPFTGAQARIEELEDQLRELPRYRDFYAIMHRTDRWPLALLGKAGNVLDLAADYQPHADQPQHLTQDVVDVLADGFTWFPSTGELAKAAGVEKKAVKGMVKTLRPILDFEVAVVPCHNRRWNAELRQYIWEPGMRRFLRWGAGSAAATRVHVAYGKIPVIQGPGGKRERLLSPCCHDELDEVKRLRCSGCGKEYDRKDPRLIHEPIADDRQPGQDDDDDRAPQPEQATPAADPDRPVRPWGQIDPMGVNHSEPLSGNDLAGEDSGAPGTNIWGQFDPMEKGTTPVPSAPDEPDEDIPIGGQYRAAVDAEVEADLAQVARAAATVQRSRPPPCPMCGQSTWWTRANGEQVCATCHPPPPGLRGGGAP